MGDGQIWCECELSLRAASARPQAAGLSGLAQNRGQSRRRRGAAGASWAPLLG